MFKATALRDPFTFWTKVPIGEKNRRFLGKKLNRHQVAPNQPFAVVIWNASCQKYLLSHQRFWNLECIYKAHTNELLLFVTFLLDVYKTSYSEKTIQKIFRSKKMRFSSKLEVWNFRHSKEKRHGYNNSEEFFI